MKEGIFREVNKYVNEIPAVVILDTINEVRRQLVETDKKQYENDIKNYESEVNKDGRGQANNRVADSGRDTE